MTEVVYHIGSDRGSNNVSDKRGGIRCEKWGDRGSDNISGRLSNNINDRGSTYVVTEEVLEVVAMSVTKAV